MVSHQRSRSDSERRPLLSRTSTAYDSEARSVKQDEKAQISTLRAVVIGFSVFVLIFILTCNVSLMTTIQSPIAEELDASSEVTWFNSAYLIAVTSLTPISGKLCQIFTPRVYLLTSIFIQAVGLLVSSQAPDVHAFLAGRAICGIGGAAVTPVAFILVTELTPVKRRAVFFGLINTGYTTGLACGAIIAGALEPVIGWRTVFWMQIPVSTAAATIAFFAIPKREHIDSDDDTMGQKLARIDYFGVATLIITLVLVLYTLSAPKLDPRPLALSTAMLILFVFVETKWAIEPIVPPSIMRSRANIFSGVAIVGVMTARWGILFYIPVYAIAVRGWAQSAAGALLVPTNAGFALGGVIAGWLHIRRTGSFYTPTLICFGLFAAIQFGVSQLVMQDSPLWLLIVSLFFNGFVVGGLLNYSLAHLLHLTLPSQHVIVIPFNATFRSFSGSFGSAISGGYFLRTLSHNLHHGFKSIGMPHNGELVRRLIGSPLLVQKLEGDERTIAIDAYTSALKATFIAGVGLALIMLVVQAAVGWVAPEENSKREADRDEIERVLSQEPATT
ncbi:hypothetical protein H2198_007508 [Neophaeococcomyces mojaviensis]|uniref:Uncharacterized protein n=1 Tax=Neophaeococcomyces mojaviensis TaxID=3383035 RepID=A0ACC3A0D6_9EURO|nr:hypothetical protein H2198_007508 [Knufia sp. JES_112]